ncbi:HAMP domain-containing sensor histidine kinase [Marinitoga sp. 38H-ov]|uniref:sensor histidine kinase n=1 Tax=Marinitoga sp. 38H-ov TaxID=1755814 RepID=UPI0013EE09ED|nr:HAMP domain-containing sensor histidine kinase [Marinitoga sp. 38H-ov]KAF2957004.1 histidine kinase [Marinitoga sp. 38H-ov]
MNFLDYLNEIIIELDGYKIKYSNKTAKEYGFKENIEIINVFTFNEIDKLIYHIINKKDYFIETTIYFFQGSSKFCKIIYLSNENKIIIEDKTEKELIKKVKSDFITSLSHELRTPLSILKGNIYLIEDLNKNNLLIKPINNSKKSLNRIERILDQLSILYMAEFDNYIIKNELLDTNKIYNEVISDLEHKIKEKNIEVINKLEVEYLNGDPFIIYTLLRNLISNSIKYSYKNSKVFVTISKNEIIVEDNGIGIRENEKNRIFERFYRGVDSRKYAKGSGLGLSIVKHLCELAGYKINFKSEWMVGSRFIIKIA